MSDDLPHEPAPEKPYVGTIGGACRVCPCGQYRKWNRQILVWACPVCQPTLVLMPSQN